MKRIKRVLTIFVMIIIAFMISKDEVKAGELPISVEGMELTTFYDGVDNTYEIVLDSNQTTVMIDYDHEEYIWGSGVGKVTLETGKIHRVILMDSEGVIAVHEIHPTLGKVKLHNLSINENSLVEDYSFIFEQNTYIYHLKVMNFIDTFQPIIEKDSETVVNISNSGLKVGDNTIKIEVSKVGLESTTYTFHIYRSYEQTSGKIEKTFEYTGDYQTFIAPQTSDYTLEVWGAQGAGNHLHNQLGYGGHGGYSKGTVHLEAGDKIYIYVGGAGKYCNGRPCTIEGGYNGGGSGITKTSSVSDTAASGGGATDMRLIPGNWDNEESLLSRFIVAGGGGAGGMDIEPAGDGGGETGYQSGSGVGKGGTQTSGWAFGKGFGAAEDTNSQHISARYGGQGAGGGWYGGYYTANGNGWAGAGGGSGFIWTKASKENVPTGYSVTEDYYLSNSVTISGNLDVPTHDGTSTMKGNIGNGYARITYDLNTELDSLTSISTDKGILIPSYNEKVKEYELPLEVNDTTLTIYAETKLGTALVTGTGTFTVQEIQHFQL